MRFFTSHCCTNISYSLAGMLIGTLASVGYVNSLPGLTPNLSIALRMMMGIVGCFSGAMLGTAAFRGTDAFNRLQVEKSSIHPSV